MSAGEGNGRAAAARRGSIAALSRGNLQEYMYLLGRRWWLIAACVVLALATALVADRLRVDRYSAEVLLQREAHTSPLDALTAGIGAPVPLEAVASQIEILRSRAVLAPVVDSLGMRLVLADRRVPRSQVIEALDVSPTAPPGVYRLAVRQGAVALVVPSSGEVLSSARLWDWIAGPGFRLRVSATVMSDEAVDFSIVYPAQAIDRLRNELRVEHVRGTILTRVRYTSTDRVLSAAVVNAVARAYQGYGARRATETATRRRQFIADQLSQVYDTLQAARQVLLNYQDTARTLDPGIEAQALAAALMQAENDVRNLRFEESILAGLVVSLSRPGGPAEGFERIITLGRDLIPGGPELYGRLQQLQEERSRLTASQFGFTAEQRQVQVIDSLIATVESTIQIVANESLTLLRQRLAAQESRARELRNEVGELPSRSSSFSQLQQRVDAVQEIFNLLVEKLYEAQIAEAVEVGDVELIDPAPVPMIPDPKRTRRNVGVAVVLGMLLGIAGVFAMEYLDTTVRRAEDAEAVGRASVLAHIPKFPEDADTRRGPALVSPRTQDLAAEAFRVLRTHLSYVKAERPRVLAVTSPGPGEGKSTMAANLAVTMGREGVRVLLIDCDLRRPSLHDVFEIPSKPGLSDLLVGEADLSQVLTRTAAQISLIPAGVKPPNPAELLRSSAFGAVIARARDEFDQILLDTPPVLAVTDPLVIAPVVDGFLVVVRVDHTDRFALARSADELGRSNVPVVGLVLNMVPTSGIYSRYGGYYGYYYYQGYGDGKGSGRGRLKGLRKLLTRTG